jgi:hypothetical protein
VVLGFTIQEPFTEPVSAELTVEHVTHSRVTGDLAVKIRHAQQGAGFTSSEGRDYTVRRVTHCAVGTAPKLS